MRIGVIIVAILLITASTLPGWEMKHVRLAPQDVADYNNQGLAISVSCTLSYFYTVPGCGWVWVIDGIEENESFGVRFNMTDEVPFHDPCDTSACLTLDALKIMLYDVLPPPADQSMNLRVYAAGEGGDPLGDLLGNVDFEPSYAGTASFTTEIIDFTKGGSTPGLDLSGCGGDFVVILTWLNSTGHPCFVLDNISTCVESCAVDPDCCQMGTYPYVYPRTTPHTHYYGYFGSWLTDPDPTCDFRDSTTLCDEYGYIEGMITSYFCTVSQATEPSTWGSIKAMYK